MNEFYYNELFAGVVWAILCIEVLYIIFINITHRIKAIVVTTMLICVIVFASYKVYQLDKLTYYNINAKANSVVK